MFRGALLLTAIIVGATVVWLREALYHRLIRFPQQEAAIAQLRATRQPVEIKTGWHEYRGVIHSHSHLSHDCEVPFESILRVLESAGRDFIALSDHCHEGRADFGAQWKGLHRGKLFIPGFEMKAGLMPFGLPSHIVLSNTADTATLARDIIRHGGVLFYAHPEEPRDWDLPELTGMEIYNIHADFKDEGRGAGALLSLLPDLLINQRRFPDLVFRTIFDRPDAILKRWDELSQKRPITGIAGNDCHQNTGIRVMVASSDTLRVEDTSPETIREFKLNRGMQFLAKTLLGPLDPGRCLLLLQLDPYERMVRFVSTHVLASSLTESSILEALRAGRAFVGFDALADSTGFVWQAENTSGRVVMGQSLAFAPGTILTAAAPNFCRFRLLRNGELLFEHQGSRLEWQAPGPGRYRVEAQLHIAGEWIPWIFSNPIRLDSTTIQR